MELGYTTWFLLAAFLVSAAYNLFLRSKISKITVAKEKYKRGIKNAIKLASGCSRCSKIILAAKRKQNENLKSK